MNDKQELINYVASYEIERRSRGDRMMDKSKLIDGGVVEYRNGQRQLIWLSQNTFFGKDGFIPFRYFNDDLTADSGGSDWDVVRIYVVDHPNILCRIWDSAFGEDGEARLIWERAPEVISVELTHDQYQKAVEAGIIE